MPVNDERANGRQRQALQRIFAGETGGWPAQFAALVGEFRGIEFVPIAFEVADDLAFWRAEILNRVVGRAEALTPRAAAITFQHAQMAAVARVSSCDGTAKTRRKMFRTWRSFAAKRCTRFHLLELNAQLQRPALG